MLHSMSASQFIGWLKFHAIEPIGTMAADLRSAQICALLANINAPKGRSYTLGDFIPNAYIPPKKQSVDDQINFLIGAFPDGKRN